MNLRVSTLEGDVMHPPREPASPRDSGRGDVDPERTARPRHARGLTGRLPEPASDVQDTLVRLDITSPAQHLIVSPQFVVILDRAGPIHDGPAYKHTVKSAR